MPAPMTESNSDIIVKVGEYINNGAMTLLFSGDTLELNYIKKK